MDITVRDLVQSDAAALSALFERCYGKTYGSPVFYDIPALEDYIASRTLRSVVATDSQTILGHTGITIRYADALICETGNTVVDPAARGHGLLRRLGAALKERVLRDSFFGYMHYPTTAHEIMQKASVSGGGREMGVMLAYVDDSTEYKAVEQRAGRLAATVAFQPFKALPAAQVYFPMRYRDLMQHLYREADLTRTTFAENVSPSMPKHAEIESHYYAARHLLSLRAAQIGQDLLPQVSGAIDQLTPAVTHIDLPLDDSAVDSTVNELVQAGFFFCAILPAFARSDLLRLQKLITPLPEDFTPDVINPVAQRLCRFMQEDAKQS
ncbi:MAG: hypothetical protein AAF512_15185 [Pseudomonadota bacterium]